MARAFTAASSHRLTLAAPVLTAYPFTMACWFFSDSDALNQNLMTISDTGGDENYFGLSAVGSVAGDPVRAYAAATGGQVNADTSVGYSINTWQHAAGVFASATDRRSYLNAGSSGSNATSRTPAGLDVTTLGTLRINAFPNGIGFMSGRIAEAAIWNVALSVQDLADLAAGFCPLMIRPDALVAYWPLIGVYSPETDEVAPANNLTLVGTAQGDHPPIIYSSGILDVIKGGTLSSSLLLRLQQEGLFVGGCAL